MLENEAKRVTEHPQWWEVWLVWGQEKKDVVFLGMGPQTPRTALPEPWQVKLAWMTWGFHSIRLSPWPLEFTAPYVARCVHRPEPQSSSLCSFQEP